MAASCRFTSLLTSSNFLPSTFLREIKLAPRILFQAQSIRKAEGRLTKPPPWFVLKRAKLAPKLEALTDENKEFLQELAVDHYTEKLSSPLKDAPWPRQPWTEKPRTIRSGVLAIKIGVLPQWTTTGKKFYTTLLQVLDNHVVRYVPPEQYSNYAACRDNWKLRRYGSLIVGALSTNPRKFSKAYVGLFDESGVPPKRKLTRFLITPNAAIQPGTPLYATHFRVGDYVDCQAKTIGHGFQGVMKRWGMKGGPATHGTTKAHRRMGAMGGGRTGKIPKGKHMPGWMGMQWRILKGLRIWRINTKYNILYVHGPCIPGPTHCYVRVYDTALHYRREALKDDPPPMPTLYPDDITEPLPEEIFHKDLFQFTDNTITYPEAVKKTR